jgi:hypothetical protein
MNDAAKTPGQSLATTSCGKSRRKLLEILKHRPAPALQPAQRRTVYWRGKDCGRLGGVAPRKAESGPLCVTDVVQTDGMSELRKEPLHDSTR